MTALLAFLARFWQPMLAVAAVVCIALAIRGYGERMADQREAQVRAEYAEALRQSQERERAANAAAHAHYEEQHAQIIVAAREPVGTRELCKPPGPVRAERASDAGAREEPAPTGVVREMPEADHGLVNDRARLLGALAAMADDQAAVNREWRARYEGSGQP